MRVAINPVPENIIIGWCEETPANMDRVNAIPLRALFDHCKRSLKRVLMQCDIDRARPIKYLL